MNITERKEELKKSREVLLERVRSVFSNLKESCQKLGLILELTRIDVCSALYEWGDHHHIQIFFRLPAEITNELLRIYGEPREGRRLEKFVKGEKERKVKPVFRRVEGLDGWHKDVFDDNRITAKDTSFTSVFEPAIGFNSETKEFVRNFGARADNTSRCTCEMGGIKIYADKEFSGVNPLQLEGMTYELVLIDSQLRGDFFPIYRKLAQQ